MVKGKEIGWFPADPAFRMKFEEAIIEGFKHFIEHGDLSYVQHILAEIPDKNARNTLIIQLKSKFPIALRKNGSLAIDPDRAEGFDWSIIEQPNIWPRRLFTNNWFSVGGESFSSSELIDEVIDALVLDRNVIPDSELQRLKSVVDRVLDRRTGAS